MKLSSKLPGREDVLLIGRVTGAHGIRGAVKVHSFSDSMTLFRAGTDILLLHASGPEDYLEHLAIQWVKPHGRGLLMGLESVDDRNGAENLAGTSIYIEKSRLPELEADTYYWSDLLGIQVSDCNGNLLGHLDAVIPTKANDVYVVKGEAAGQARELLIPAIAKFIRSVDIQARTMVVDPPGGI